MKLRVKVFRDIYFFVRFEYLFILIDVVILLWFRLCMFNFGIVIKLSKEVIILGKRFVGRS